MKNMKKQRKGFTLIELMIVIAIIVILAAIAIPNYLNMTDRAKRSRVASDFDTIATALEAYNTDWGHYPDTQVSFGNGNDFPELSGGEDAEENVSGVMTVTGMPGGIVYIKQATIEGMVNPFDSEDGYTYEPNADATGWTLYCKVNDNTWLTRTDSNSAIVESDAGPTTP